MSHSSYTLIGKAVPLYCHTNGCVYPPTCDIVTTLQTKVHKSTVYKTPQWRQVLTTATSAHIHFISLRLRNMWDGITKLMFTINIIWMGCLIFKKSTFHLFPSKLPICLFCTSCDSPSKHRDRAKVQSESWQNVLDGERHWGWHWSRRQWGRIHQCRCSGPSRHIPSSRIVVVEECWARLRESAFFLLSVRLSFRDSRRKRLSRPKVGLALVLLLLRLLSSTASAPSARSPVHKH